jgi:hypothetical protein
VASWLKWGVPLVGVVLLAAAVGGLGARHLDNRDLSVALLDKPPLPSASPAQGPPGKEPGSSVVEFSPGAEEHPDSGKVRWLLQIHFLSINEKRYDQWATTVVAAKRQELPESKWRNEYSTTTDGTIKVHEIEPGPDDSLRVMLSFTSVQDPSHAPPQVRERCVRWRVVYPLLQDSNDLRLDTSKLPGSAVPAPCR